MKKVLIIGFGHIGHSTVKYLKDCDIWLKDQDNECRNLRTDSLLLDPKEVKADYWVICVPGAGEKDGHIDTSLVDKYVSEAKDCGAEPIVRTTLPLIYKEEDITYWPSFVTDYDMEEQRIVMSSRGYENGFCKYINEGIMFLSLHDAIIAKLYSNAYLAMRVEFFNRVADFSENAPAVINSICADRRIGSFYNYAERKRWGGKCFVKDMNELAEHDELMKQVNESNKRRSE